jgi:hypothetical protein
MIRKTTLAAATLALLGGCGGGDINLTPTNIDNSVDNSVNTSGGGANNPCANYTDPASNTQIQGTFDGQNCRYGSDFVGALNPLTVDLTIPFISGVHIFEDSLFVGENTDGTGPTPPQEGEGPTLTIRPGNTLAFLDSSDYVLITRGSQIVAAGTPTAPITFTAFSDAVLGVAGPEDVSLWGGIQINGNGITNNCTDAERAALTCNQVAEGQPSNFGGNNNAENSGILRYVVSKYSGFEVAPGDELNGITFNAVGSGTTVENVEVYSTFDDGFEFFGGAVDVNRAVLLYVRDDSLDFSDGYVGSISEALVIHPLTDGNRCIEGDNIGQGRSDRGEPLDLAPQSNPIFTNLTCIPSSIDENVGTHGDSEGFLLRLGARGQLNRSIVYSGYGEIANATTSNECFELDDAVTTQQAQDGLTTFTNSIIACSLPTQDSLPNGDTLAQWFTNTGTVDYAFNVAGGQPNVIEADPTNANVSILAPNDYRVAGYDAGADETTFTLSDASTVTFPGQIGAVTPADDWTATWTFGLKPSNQAQPLYFQ